MNTKIIQITAKTTLHHFLSIEVPEGVDEKEILYALKDDCELTDIAQNNSSDGKIASTDYEVETIEKPREVHIPFSDESLQEALVSDEVIDAEFNPID